MFLNVAEGTERAGARVVERFKEAIVRGGKRVDPGDASIGVLGLVGSRPGARGAADGWKSLVGARRRQETTLTMAWIARRLPLGSVNTLKNTGDW